VNILFFRRDSNDFLWQLVAMDETWLYHNDFETKQKSIEWGEADHPGPKIYK